MAQGGCSEDQFRSDKGNCCRLCDAGTYKQKDCDRTAKTQCGDCGRGYFTGARNHMEECRQCQTCNSKHNQIKVQECTARKDTVCACEPGFYCIEADCEYCRRVSDCPEGQGVKTPATRTNNTVCSPCEPGSFSNVSDHLSVCKAHTRCEDIGRELYSPGTATSDAICGNFKTSCGWMLPAGLWIGLVLTSLIVFALVLFWRIRRCRLQRAVTLSLPEAPMDVVQAEEVQLKLPLPSKELNDFCQEQTYRPSYSCELPAFESDNKELECDAQDTEVSNVPIAPLKTPASFTESQHLNGSSGYSTNYHRTISEPQEDEWCGT